MVTRAYISRMFSTQGDGDNSVIQGWAMCNPLDIAEVQVS